MPNSRLRRQMEAVNRLLTILVLVCALFYVWSRHKTGQRPASSEIDSKSYQEPIQEKTFEAPFKFDYRTATYLVEPVAEYEISGLVVSHNNIMAFADIYHDHNSVDIKDVCILWGENLKGDVQQKLDFYNESVSCHVANIPNGIDFRENQFSNNHLLSDNEDVRTAIADTRVGDQVTLRGWLVNYADSRSPQLKRISSTTRKDTAGGACEVMFVNEVNFIKKTSRIWYDRRDLAFQLLCYALIIKVVAFILLPYLQYRYT